MIRRLHRWLGGFINQPQATPPLAAVPAAPAWSEIHRGNLEKFLNSETGRVFVERMRAVEYKNAVAASADAFHPTHSAGRALGFTDAIKWLYSLSLATGESVAKNDTDSSGEATASELSDYIARISP